MRLANPPWLRRTLTCPIPCPTARSTHSKDITRHRSTERRQIAERQEAFYLQKHGSSLGSMSGDPGFNILRQQAATAFPQIPISSWKNSFYYVPTLSTSGAANAVGKVSLLDVPKPRWREVAVPHGVLSPFKRPPAGLDVRRIELDREAFRTCKYDTHARRLLRVHFASCQTVKDVLHVVALSMKRKVTAAQLAPLHLRIIQALFRARARVSDQRICSALRMIIKRQQMAGLPVPYELYACGLKFAARSRNIDRFRWFLVQFRQSNLSMSRNLFRSVIAKCSIGDRGFGEIRNGKWDHDELREILFGFSNAETEVEKHAHLEAWLERNDWQEIHAWLQILAVIGEKEKARQEWAIWNGSAVRIDERPWRTPRHPVSLSTRLRGDCFFLRMMWRFDDKQTAWRILVDNPSVWALLDAELKEALKAYGEKQAGAMESLSYAMSPATEGQRAMTG